MRTITLSNEVMVSDPCYKVPTWCQHKLSNVLPGEYHCMVQKFDDSMWGNRCSYIIAVHKDYNTEDRLNWRTVTKADIGVDSGQAGIFSMETYRVDGLDIEVPTIGYDGNSFEWFDSMMSKDQTEGNEWYTKMSKITLTEEGWGSYNNGIVSRSGLGDGSYELRVAKHKGKVIGILVNFLMENLTGPIIEGLRITHMLGDVCGVCGEDNVDGVTCNCLN